MWKESYKTGVERIDFQHKSLFDKTGELVQAVEDRAGPYTYEQILTFLKGYVVSHFRDEEKYQQSIGYRDFEAHQKAHKAFAETILDYERRLIENNYDLCLVKDLAGTLTTWLIYHVAYTDQRMVHNRRGQDSTGEESPLHVITESLSDTLQAVTGLEPSHFHIWDASAVELAPAATVEVGLFGGINGTLRYAFTEEIAASLFRRMTFQTPESMDEMVCSALAEISNITSGNATVRMAGRGIACDITPPKVTIGGNGSFGGLVLDIGEGMVRLSTDLDQY